MGAPHYGHLPICSRLANVHAIPQNHQNTSSRSPKPLVPSTLILIEVSRLPGRMQALRVLRLWWYRLWVPTGRTVCGCGVARLVRRLDLKPTYRVVRQGLKDLNGTMPRPRPRHPKQADPWPGCGWSGRPVLAGLHPAASHPAPPRQPALALRACLAMQRDGWLACLAHEAFIDGDQFNELFTITPMIGMILLCLGTKAPPNLCDPSRGR